MGSCERKQSQEFIHFPVIEGINFDKIYNTLFLNCRTFDNFGSQYAPEHRILLFLEYSAFGQDAPRPWTFVFHLLGSC